MTLERPTVIRLITYVRVPRDVHRRKITRKAVLARDSWTCQYCGSSKPGLTVDHVIPRSRGGESVWENIVASCAPCNRRKGNRLPREIAMHPRTRPRAPARRLHPHRRARIPAAWERYPYLTGTALKRPLQRRIARLGGRHDPLADQSAALGGRRDRGLSAPSRTRALG